MNLIRLLNLSFNIPTDEIERGIVSRAEAVYPDTHHMEQWIDHGEQVPPWAHRAAAKWLIELWMHERNECTPQTLLAIDKKYTTYLNGFSMGEIIAMQQSLANPGKVF